MCNLVAFPGGKKDEPAAAFDQRSKNIIIKEISEVIAAALPNIDEEYDLIEYTDGGSIFELNHIDNEGYMTTEEIEYCKKKIYELSPLVTNFALTIKEKII